MATGHVLPGYRNPVSRLRSNSADPTYSGHRYRHGWRRDAEPSELSLVRETARRAWEEEVKEWDRTPHIRPTTYSHSYYAKSHLSPQVKPIARPVSPTRRHKPHPPEVFLKCRLHHIPGYHNTRAPEGMELGSVEGFSYPDTTIKEEVYVVDANCPEYEQRERHHLRRKYIGRSSSATAMGFSDSKLTRVIQDPLDSQAAEAWMKLASEKDRQNVQRVFDRDERLHHDRQTEKPSRLRSNSAFVYGASTRRYLRATGAEESASVERLMETLASGNRSQPRMSGPHFHNTDYSSTLKRKSHIKVNPKFTRTDFIIHPDFYP